MNPWPRARTALFVLALLAPLPARAQGADAGVLPRGFLELRGTGIFTHFDDYFTAGGVRRNLAGPLLPPLQAALDRALEAPVDTTRDRMQAFLAGTGGVPAGVDPHAAGSGQVRMEASADIRTIPVTLAYGATRRLTLSLTVPLERRGTSIQSRYLAGGSLGVNPETARNQELLGRMDPAFGALGASPLFPVAGSPLAMVLNQRLQAALGDTVELVFPTRPLALDAALTAVGAAGLLTPAEEAALTMGSDRTPYLPGDAEFGLRFLLLPGAGAAVEPENVRGPALRTVLGVRGRLPTGSRTGGRLLLEIPSEHGHAGFGLDVGNALFLSRRVQVNAEASYDVRMPARVQRRAFTAERPFPTETELRIVHREPGARASAAVAPHFHLTNELSFGARYAFARAGETVLRPVDGDEDAWVVPGPTEPLGAWTAHRWGVGARYSTLSAFTAGRTPVPLEVALLFERTFAGAGGAAALSRVNVTGRVFAPARQLARLIPSPRAEEEEPPAEPDLQPAEEAPAAPPAGPDPRG